jgi:hypothetical protein
LNNSLFLIDPKLLENSIKAPGLNTSSDEFFKELCLGISKSIDAKRTPK